MLDEVTLISFLLMHLLGYYIVRLHIIIINIMEVKHMFQGGINSQVFL